ncbi:hypothetical protein BUALT_Bualt11G0070700 [Buddleja alternifolia]|uniref:Uncharacterized protein n=1 Tax=Buddleja alternifolia TaxID=168488 RepID=A0AAV6WT69_9LAMI|nr:hypothetical protein BUALT_Bualt11G0070700 [Buddleja alternifolia]
MATDVLEIVNIDDDDDEISIIYATPLSINKGTSKSDAISVEDYPIRAKTTVDLSKHTSYLFDDEVILLDSFPKILSRVCKGESSNTKPAKATELIIPLTFMCEICADEKPRTDMFLEPQHCRQSFPKQVFDRWAMLCKVPWHSGISCVEFQKLKKDERSHEDILLMNLAKSVDILFVTIVELL